MNGIGEPTIMPNDQYTEMAAPVFENNVYKFKVARPFYAKGDHALTLECGKRYLFSWVGCSTHSKLNIKHDHQDRFNLLLTDECSVNWFDSHNKKKVLDGAIRMRLGILFGISLLFSSINLF